MYDEFTFAGIGSLEYAVICASFESSAKSTYESQTSKLSTDLAGNGIDFEIYDQKYSEPIVFDFTVIRKDGGNITQEHERYLNKWLCGMSMGTYQWMYISSPRYADIHFLANISNPVATVVSDVVGITYTCTLSSPLAYSDEYVYNVDFTANDKSTDIYLFNDDGANSHVFPVITVTMKEGGDFRLHNSRDDESEFLEVKNVQVGEVITIDNQLPYISSSIESHNIWSDFNKKWTHLYDDLNTLSSNLQCSLEIKFREYRRMAVF